MTALAPLPASGTPGARPSSPGSGRRRWHLAGHLVVAAWLAAAVVVAAAHPLVPRARWLTVHLTLLGAVGTAVLIWSEHFALTLLHRPEHGRGRGRAGRLAAFTMGALCVTAGMAAHAWPTVLAGGVVVGGVAVAHTVSLARAARGALGGRFAVVVRYYLAAAALLPVGTGLGITLARKGLDDDLEARLRLAHEAVNGLGFVGLTVLGTLVTLWPTMLRTRIAEGAERAAREALPWLVTGTALLAGIAMVAPPPVALAGAGCYAVGVGRCLVPLGRSGLSRPPAGAPTWSMLAATGWLLASLAGIGAVLATSTRWTDVGDRLAALTPVLAVGWIAQTLLAALAYLVPVVVGGGPTTVRAMVAVLERAGAARVTVRNGALAVAVLPVTGTVRTACAACVLAVLVADAWLIARAAWRGRSVRRSPEAPRPGTGTVGGARPRPLAGAGVGLAVVVLAVAGGVAVDPASLTRPTGTGTAAAVVPTGRTTTATVLLKGMRFSPDRIDVPAGDRLRIAVRNADDDRHDLVLATGPRLDRLAPGASGTLDAGVIGADVEGWCSVAGHRQLGMTLTVHAVGVPRLATSAPGTASGDAATSGADASFDPMASPPPGSVPREARLAPLPDGSGPRLHRRTITVREVRREVAPGVRQTAWTFDGTVPGPVLHGRVGDTFEITLVNGGSIGHSIDFHAGSVAPASVMRTIQPGASLVYRFTATHSGIWMYHCSTMPMSVHIANGMFGAVVIDPPDLAPVADEYVLIQSEEYLGPQDGTADVATLRSAQPQAVVFNGYPNQYVSGPLTATVGQRVRLWVLDAGPNLDTSFHVVGAQFDTVFAEGGYRLRPGDAAAGGAQSLGLGPAEGGFVELTFPEAGAYPFVSHRMVDAERGARGIIQVR